MATAGSIEGKSKEARGLHSDGFALAFAFAVLLFGLASSSISRPPRADIHRDLSIGGGLAAIVLALLTARPRSREWVSTITLLLAVAGLWGQFDNYLANYTDYPWLFLVPALLFCTFGSLLRGLRVTATLMALIFVAWFGPILVPERTDLPLSQREGDTVATLRSLAGKTVIELRGPADRDIAEIFNLDTVDLQGQVGPLIHLDLKGRRFHIEPTARNVVVLSPLDAPSWVRSIGIRLQVARWPSQSAVSLEVPAPGSGTPKPREVHEQGGGLQLAIRDVRISETTNRLPPIPCIALTATTGGLPYGGWRARSLRIRDQEGHLLEGNAGMVIGKHGGADVSIEIAPIPRNLKSLRFDLYSDEQLEAATVAFSFDRAP
ncbi:MAG: hypothetical protein M9921_01075 [Fimbriimonadaceae bacterium]|nr:hypothetical protein [Fimbriimonadaceae bacterium]